MRLAALVLAAAVTAAALPTAASAQMAIATSAELKKFNVAIRRFDPARGPASGQEFVLPIESPDEEHAIASTLANAASFSKKVEGGRALPVAFLAVRVGPR